MRVRANHLTYRTVYRLVHSFIRGSLWFYRFIGELYNHGVYPEKLVWSIVTDLTDGESSNLKMYCLGMLIESAGSKLSKVKIIKTFRQSTAVLDYDKSIYPQTYNLTKAVEHLMLYIVNRDSRDKNVLYGLRRLIERLYETYATDWQNNGNTRRKKKITICFYVRKLL